MISREWYRSFDWKEMFEKKFLIFFYMQQYIFIKSYQKKKGRKEMFYLIMHSAHFIYRTT